MAKRKTEPEIDILTLDYQLAELPSSQHRAGLAGLTILLDQWLPRQPDEHHFQQKVADGAVCKLTRVDSKGATFELNQQGIQALFNEIYAASTEEQERPQVLKNSRTKEIIPPLDEKEIEVEDKNGKTKSKKVYIYPITVPKGSFLADQSFDKSFDGKNGVWIKLWRDMVWSILRGVPATRQPFEARAEGNYIKDAETVWKQLIQPEDFTVDLPSTYFLGAQASNAENVPFKDRARLQFLLHFWLFTAQIYVPATIDNEGKRNFTGYALAIPDVCDLKRFCKRLPKVLSERSTKPSRYRPRESVVDVAVESALDLMRRLDERLIQKTGEEKTASTVFGIDVIHTEKQGNNIRILGSSRLKPKDSQLDDYARIRDGFWNPLFRRQCLLNLVADNPWYRDFDTLLCTLPYELSIENDYFRRDVREKFKSLSEVEEKNMSEAIKQAAPKSIETLVFQLTKNYVRRKLKAKYDLEWKNEWSDLKSEDLSKQPGYDNYSKMKTKVAKSAFLEVRSRTEQWDFIKYFTGTLCSVPQYMGSESYVQLAKDLYNENEYEKIRTLTLLALSANS